MVANNHSRSHGRNVFRYIPLYSGYKDPDQKKEALVKGMIQALEHFFAVSEKQVCGQVKGSEENDKSEGIIRPEQQGYDQINSRF